KYLSSLKNSGIDRNSPDMEREFVINLLYGLASANPVLEAQSEISLFLQTVGGSSGGKLDFIHSEVMTNGMKGKIGASAIIRLKKDYKMVIDRISSFEQVKGSLKVTALENPRHIRELNGKPALDEYLSSVGETKDNLSASLFARYTLGIEPGDGEKLITSIMKDDGKGGLLTYNDLVEGTELNIYSAKSQEADRKSQLQSLKSLEPIIYISFDCVLCYLARNAMDEKEKIAKLYSENLPNTGVMGFGTFSENICGANVNQTETFLAIYKA
ncbi:MAG: FIST C-terminal domain-containing protein, partial [Leptospiraceae bacterium]|nr:FIST C-terminal domain-containing protein [Leptospiraceae bacterium]